MYMHDQVEGGCMEGKRGDEGESCDRWEGVTVRMRMRMKGGR